jgi:hypothetical protein
MFSEQKKRWLLPKKKVSFCAAWNGTDKTMSVRQMVDNLGKNIIGIEVGVLLTTL